MSIEVAHPKIIPVAGPSGVGKTSLVGGVLKARQDIKLITSLTTRGPRSNDLPGEYEYFVKPKILRAMDCSGKLLWLVEGHGNLYGTTVLSVKEALLADILSFMILKPEAVRMLIKVVRRQNVFPLFVHIRRASVLRERILSRGDDVVDAENRLKECRLWATRARRSKVGYTFIDNSDVLSDGVSKICSIIDLLNSISSGSIVTQKQGA